MPDVRPYFENSDSYSLVLLSQGNTGPNPDSVGGPPVSRIDQHLCCYFWTGWKPKVFCLLVFSNFHCFFSNSYCLYIYIRGHKRPPAPQFSIFKVCPLQWFNLSYYHACVSLAHWCVWRDICFPTEGTCHPSGLIVWRNMTQNTNIFGMLHSNTTDWGLDMRNTSQDNPLDQIFSPIISGYSRLHDIFFHLEDQGCIP